MLPNDVAKQTHKQTNKQTRLLAYLRRSASTRCFEVGVVIPPSFGLLTFAPHLNQCMCWVLSRVVRASFFPRLYCIGIGIGIGVCLVVVHGARGFAKTRIDRSKIEPQCKCNATQSTKNGKKILRMGWVVANLEWLGVQIRTLHERDKNQKHGSIFDSCSVFVLYLCKEWHNTKL